MKCPFCGSLLVRRPPMEHATVKRVKPNGKPAQRDIHRPRKGWWCPGCKRVVRGEA